MRRIYLDTPDFPSSSARGGSSSSNKKQDILAATVTSVSSIPSPRSFSSSSSQTNNNEKNKTNNFGLKGKTVKLNDYQQQFGYVCQTAQDQQNSTNKNNQEQQEEQKDSLIVLATAKSNRLESQGYKLDVPPSQCKVFQKQLQEEKQQEKLQEKEKQKSGSRPQTASTISASRRPLFASRPLKSSEKYSRIKQEKKEAIQKVEKREQEKREGSENRIRQQQDQESKNKSTTKEHSRGEGEWYSRFFPDPKSITLSNDNDKIRSVTTPVSSSSASRLLDDNNNSNNNTFLTEFRYQGPRVPLTIKQKEEVARLRKQHGLSSSSRSPSHSPSPSPNSSSRQQQQKQEGNEFQNENNNNNEEEEIVRSGYRASPSRRVIHERLSDMSLVGTSEIANTFLEHRPLSPAPSYSYSHSSTSRKQTHQIQQPEQPQQQESPPRNQQKIEEEQEEEGLTIQVTSAQDTKSLAFCQTSRPHPGLHHHHHNDKANNSNLVVRRRPPSANPKIVYSRTAQARFKKEERQARLVAGDSKLQQRQFDKTRSEQEQQRQEAQEQAEAEQLERERQEAGGDSRLAAARRMLKKALQLGEEDKIPSSTARPHITFSPFSRRKSSIASASSARSIASTRRPSRAFIDFHTQQEEGEILDEDVKSDSDSSAESSSAFGCGDNNNNLYYSDQFGEMSEEELAKLVELGIDGEGGSQFRSARKYRRDFGRGKMVAFDAGGSIHVVNAISVKGKHCKTPQEEAMEWKLKQEEARRQQEEQQVQLQQQQRNQQGRATRPMTASSSLYNRRQHQQEMKIAAVKDRNKKQVTEMNHFVSSFDFEEKFYSNVKNLHALHPRAKQQQLQREQQQQQQKAAAAAAEAEKEAAPEDEGEENQVSEEEKRLAQLQKKREEKQRRFQQQQEQERQLHIHPMTRQQQLTQVSYATTLPGNFSQGIVSTRNRQRAEMCLKLTGSQKPFQVSDSNNVVAVPVEFTTAAYVPRPPSASSSARNGGTRRTW